MATEKKKKPLMFASEFQQPLISLKELRVLRKKWKPIKVTITVPATAVQLFKIMAVVFEMDESGLASKALIDWLHSEEAMNSFDDMVNRRFPK